MQTPEELMQHIEKCLSGIEGEPGHEKVVLDCGLGAELIRARDAEWQIRVDTLLEDNARSEEQVKKQFATAVSFKARAEKAEARVEKLRTVLTGLLLAKDVLFRCVCEADDEEHLQSLVDSTDDLWNDARAALGRE